MHLLDKSLMVFNAFDETLVRSPCPVLVEFAGFVQAVNIQFVDRIYEYIDLDLQFFDKHHHRKHHCGDVSQYAKSYDELDDVQDGVPGERGLPRNPHRGYIRVL